jgi:AraC-like DNA-binding protein
MAVASRYAVDMGWALMLGQLGVSGQDVLRTARLPLDLFRREAASVTSLEYFQLWEALATVSGDPLLPLRMAEVMTAEAFGRALFACLCSESLDAALKRLAEYKPLVGPMQLVVKKGASETEAEIRGLPGGVVPPALLVAAELVFFTHLARLGTRDRIAPARVDIPVPLPEPRAYADWFGCAPQEGDTPRIAFRRLDAERPFLTASPAMWAAFEPSLRQRLSDATAQVSMSGRLRGWLNETIASGRTGIAEAARDLGVSARTLQRRLSDEGTSFQQELSAVREKLARHYLTELSSATVRSHSCWDMPSRTPSTGPFRTGPERRPKRFEPD